LASDSELAAAIVLAVYAEDDHRFGHARRLVVVRNLPPRAMFEELPETPRKRQLIHLGDISESRRGVSVLIEMLALMHNRDVSLVFVGKADSPQTRRRLDELVAHYHLTDRVRFVSQVPYETVKSYLVESAVGLIPLRAIQRWQFDVPQKAFEYMACRLPFVVSETHATRKFAAETGVGLVVESQSAQAFADAVDFLLDNPVEANRMADRGRRAFLEEYNWEKESQKLLELYDVLQFSIGK
jgi:colanic acid biosynthesis glycosyl transferase WcaI